MSKFATCDKCKEDYFYTEDHVCERQLQLDCVQTWCYGGAFQIGGRPRITKVLLEFKTMDKKALDFQTLCQIEQAEHMVIQCLDNGAEVLVDVDGKEF